MEDTRDRLARAEQNIINTEKNFAAFKQDDFQSLKTEVHAMRGEFNKKLDALLDKLNTINDAMQARTNAINLTMAKWIGAGGVLIFLGEFLLKMFLG